MQIYFTKSFGREIKKTVKGNLRLKKQVDKQLRLLIQNPHHPSLRLHKVQNSGYWSISIDMSIRILINLESDVITVFAIGKHEDVY